MEGISMYCKKCGMEVSENDKFCPTCGADLSKQEEEKEVDPFEKFDDKKEEVTPSKADKVVYRVFAIVSFVTGIVSLCLVWVPFIFYGSIPGIVLGKLGESSTTQKDKAKRGFVMSIVATAINLVWTIVFIVLIMTFAKEEGEIIVNRFYD
jgi:lipopolysaccharide/colanic/teichoic acid biosynthesis glycosyltransferase